MEQEVLSGGQQLCHNPRRIGLPQAPPAGRAAAGQTHGRGAQADCTHRPQTARRPHSDSRAPSSVFLEPHYLRWPPAPPRLGNLPPRHPRLTPHTTPRPRGSAGRPAAPGQILPPRPGCLGGAEHSPATAPGRSAPPGRVGNAPPFAVGCQELPPLLCAPGPAEGGGEAGAPRLAGPGRERCGGGRAARGLAGWAEGGGRRSAHLPAGGCRHFSVPFLGGGRREGEP